MGRQALMSKAQNYFPGKLIYLELYIENNGRRIVMQGQQSDIQRSWVIYIIFWPGGLVTSYDPF